MLLLETLPAFPPVPPEPSGCDDARTLLVDDDGQRLCAVGDERLDVVARVEDGARAYQQIVLTVGNGTGHDLQAGSRAGRRLGARPC